MPDKIPFRFWSTQTVSYGVPHEKFPYHFIGCYSLILLHYFDCKSDYATSTTSR
ncbi:hypothetical protein VIBNIFTn2_120100 [Vibrio nigripulchritudo FTn2]|nr:hypothetical protein VIBNIFTn2_120100 [Vibrio nigripulchritudo FTn2]